MFRTVSQTRMEYRRNAVCSSTLCSLCRSAESAHFLFSEFMLPYPLTVCVNVTTDEAGDTVLEKSLSSVCSTSC